MSHLILNFECCLKTPSSEKKYQLSQAISNSSGGTIIKSISPGYIVIFIQGFRTKDIRTFINSVKTFGVEESPKHRHKNLYNRSLHWYLTNFRELCDNKTAKYAFFK